MDKQKLRNARRSGFIYGLFRASALPTEILPKNLAREVYKQSGQDAPSSLTEMRHMIKHDMMYDAVGFIPTRDKKGVQMITLPYNKPKPRRMQVEDDVELEIEPGDHAELQINPEDYDDEIEIPIDRKLRNRAARKRLKRAQAEYEETQARRRARENDPEYIRLANRFM